MEPRAEWVRAQSLAILTGENTSPVRAWSLRSQWGFVKGCKWGENPCLYSNTSLELRDARRLILKKYILDCIGRIELMT